MPPGRSMSRCKAEAIYHYPLLSKTYIQRLYRWESLITLTNATNTGILQRGIITQLSALKNPGIEYYVFKKFFLEIHTPSLLSPI